MVKRHNEFLTVHVGGAPYDAILDKGVLRFKDNWAVQALLNDRNAVDMNALAMMYLTKKLNLREYAEFHMMIGYSLDGFAELSSFSDLEVRTPNWTRKGRTPWD